MVFEQVTIIKYATTYPPVNLKIPLYLGEIEKDDFVFRGNVPSL